MIPYDSHQDIKHKIAALHSVAHRLVTLPLTDVAYARERQRQSFPNIGQMKINNKFYRTDHQEA